MPSPGLPSPLLTHFLHRQMALSNYDFSSLAHRYDRIMNASQGNMQPKSRQAEVFSSIITTIGQIVASFQLRFRFDSQLKPNSLEDDLSSVHSVASHITPGEISWHEAEGSHIDFDSASGSKFSSFFINMANVQVQSETTIFDNREEFDSVSVST